MILKKSIKTLGNITLLGASTIIAYKTIADKLFDSVFKKNDQEFKLDTIQLDFLNKSKTTKVNIKSYDGLNLNGLLIENHKTNNYVILVHGIWSNSNWMVPHAYELDKLGYNILLIDQRASGLSEGNYYTYGFKESFDLINWTNYLINLNKKINIIYFGVSMGAATCMITTNNILPTNVKCIIEDCGFSSMKQELAHVLITKYNVLKPYPVLNIFEGQMYAKLGFKFKDIEPSMALRNNDIPLLIVHGEEDNFVPFKMSKIIYNNQKGIKKYYPVPNSKHACAVHDKKYFVNIDKFIKNFVE